MVPENWKNMSSEEKFEFLWATAMSTEGKPFASPEVAEKYRRRMQRLKDVCQLKKPDRVPGILSCGNVVATWAGVTHGDLMYDMDKAVDAVVRFNREFQPDYQTMGNCLPGKGFSRLGVATYRWPGDGLPPTVPFQMVEGEYMRDDEYDDLIADPGGFYLRVYMPRAFTALKGLALLPNLYSTVELPVLIPLLGAFAAEPMQETLRAMIEAGQAANEWFAAAAKAGNVLAFELGEPAALLASFTKAPFDIIADTMRGTRGIMLDMYRQPKKVLAAVEALTPIAVKVAVEGAISAGNPLVFIPLHKGADGFMSDKDFRTFYWPSLKATLLGLIEAGTVPLLFVEGSYNSRLDVIAESGIPAGKSLWMFDKSDMKAVKEKFGSWACFGGNVPVSMFYTATPEELSDYIKRLIDTVGQDGGFFIAPGAVIDDSRPENLHAFVKTVREYGVYA